jgi:decaprenylphospho-beta-D-erythro-pentofuranosid-2-ulose 2-reductase
LIRPAKNSLGAPTNVLLVGATSSIATAVAKIYAARGARLFLVGRNEDHLRSISDALRNLGADQVSVFVTDFNNKASHEVLVKAAREKLGTIDVAILAQGVMPKGAGLEIAVDEVLDSLVTNLLSVVSISHRIAQKLKEQRSGTLAVLSSVAGERGRMSNYVYGSSKAALTAYCSGLRAELAPYAVNVLTVKPGVVDTPMTKDKDVPFKASVEKVATDIVQAIDRGSKVLYTPWYWKWIMILVRSLPERLFMKIKS